MEPDRSPPQSSVPLCSPGDAAAESLNDPMLRSVFSAVPIGICIVRDDVIQSCNDALCTLTGYAHRELLGANTRIFHSSRQDQEYVRRELAHQLSRTGRASVETNLKCKDGAILNVIVTQALLSPQDPSAGFVFSVQDITSRKKSEAVLRNHIHEIERFNRLATAREMRVLELKQQINALAREASRPEPYSTSDLETAAPLSDTAPCSETLHHPAPSLPPDDLVLSELLDHDEVQRLLESFCDAVGISAAIIDLQGNVFVGARWQRICTDFHRIDSRTLTRCLASDTEMAIRLNEGEAFALYQCCNGLTDAASPIWIEGHHVGNAFIGQFLLQPPDLLFFRCQAAEFGFNENEYLEALSQVPIVPKQKLSGLLSYLTALARMLAQMGLERKRSILIQRDMQQRTEELNRVAEELQRQGRAAISLAEDANEAKSIAEAAQQSLRESEERLHGLTSAALDAIVMIDDQGRISFWNQAAEDMFGWPPQEALGYAMHKLLAPMQYRDQANLGLAQFAATGKGNVLGHTLELTALRRNGDEFPVELSVASLCLQGKYHAVGIIRDITARKQVEATLQQAKKAAESASQAKSTFLANVSHELRTPLTSILGYTNLLLEECVGRSALEHVRVVKRNGEHLLQIINNILDLTAIEAGQLNVECVECSLFDIVNSVTRTLSKRAFAKGLTLTVECRDDAPVRIYTDPARVRQILQSLVDNAIKFTDHGSVRIVLQRSNETPSTLFCDICDTGVGLTETQSSNLFQPFWQMDASSTRRFAGVGLGLAISKSLSQQLGGDLTLISSQAGQGSQFRLTLPIAPAGRLLDEPMASAHRIRKHTPSQPAASPPPLAGHHVILADDCSDDRRLITFILQKAGAETLAVSNDQQVIDALLAAQKGDNQPDAILLNTGTPTSSGPQTVQKLRQLGYKGYIVAITAHTTPEDRERYAQAGYDSYLTKPLNRESVLNAIAGKTSIKS